MEFRLSDQRTRGSHHTEAESSYPRLELLDIPRAASQIAIHAVENLRRGLAVDGAEIGARLSATILPQALQSRPPRSLRQSELS